LILSGDAAGILDPAAGQGIFNALLSGIKAGQTAIACLLDPALEAVHLALYDDWFVRQFEAKSHQLHQYYLDHKINIF
jgi:flavin-dependent dehydrogenase